MNASNPFQIPSGLQASLQQRRRERFKRGVIGIVAGTTVLLAVLLILGCNNEHARAASVRTVAADDSTVTPAAPAGDLAMKPGAVSDPMAPVPSPIIEPASAPIVSKAGAPIYVVKPADTLNRIAKIHGTTVHALKVANGLDTDRIGIGMKLKMPEA